MQLQKEIKTSRFENVHQQTVVNVLFTYGWCNDKLKEAVLPYDITIQQFNILRILRGQHPNPSTTSLLRARMLDKMCDVSRIVDRLIQKELALKKGSTSDKRSVDILITGKGLALLEKMDKEVDLAVATASNLTVEEALTLNALLDKMRG
ncbi:DNA-binding transcriptional regulator, MarR family [Pedobacter sp. ok626]|uniref:MarR family winged helix-turn-helix transcriptional regulator n=1 Tax=Pedobacter sp. ok626 TaxID=1761882 RepID=UPI00088177EC|nr:MarR family transcriptional regulator [Pedobacter sp. ok626]SDJ91893.1 DNA-binding transcriptional regulator, MarR family [Pedobacter sp. ok626]